MQPLLCLVFIQSLAGQSLLIPSQVDQLAKSRILQQIHAKSPQLMASFADDPTCPEQVKYFYSGDSIVLEGHNSVWDGRTEFSLTDLMDGKSLDLRALKIEKNPSSNTLPQFAADPLDIQSTPKVTKKKWSSWRPLAIAAAGVLIGAFIYSQQGQDSAQSATPAPSSAETAIGKRLRK